jgi:protein-tyrosine phosphatase
MTGIYDIHAHILPGIDDGPDTLDLSMRMLEAEYADGVRTVFATSHFRRGMFEPSPSAYADALERVRAAAAQRFPDLRILEGCEFHANMEMTDVLARGERLPLGGGRCVLTEFSGGAERAFIRERCYALMSHGWRPVVAHAERCSAFRRDPDLLSDAVGMGVLIQLNAAALLGADGFAARRFCTSALKRGLCHFVADDAHNMTDRRPRMGACAARLTRLLGAAGAEEILIKNPEKLIFAP